MNRERHARVCPAKDCNWRSFGDPDARCPEHRRSVPQEDKPYGGFREPPRERRTS